MIDQYSKLTTEQLIAELGKQMAGKNVSPVIEKLKPLLNAEQRGRLDEVLQKVNNGQ
jgi:hypothetical protein